MSDFHSHRLGQISSVSIVNQVFELCVLTQELQQRINISLPSWPTPRQLWLADPRRSSKRDKNLR